MLTFPNAARVYDRATDRISFWGHDGMLEVPFSLLANTLLRLYPRTGSSDAAILQAFDAGVDRVHEIAAQAYRRDRRSFYVLGPDSI